MAETLGISKLDQVAVRVENVDRAVAFYRDILELQHMFTAGEKLAFFDCGGTRLMLSKPEKPEFDHPSSILYFKVPDIHAAYAKLLERKVRAEDKPHMIANMGTHELWMAFFRDSEGNMLALSADVPVGSMPND